MPSITYWSRLEPRPRAASITNSLAARVRDPLWMLTRQWQLGAVDGEDAASPAFAQLAASFGPFLSWSAADGDARPLPPNSPLEAVALAEDFSQTDPSFPGDFEQTLDLSLAVELGQVFEQALVDLGRDDLIGRFRSAYPVDSEVTEVDPRDRAALGFLQVAAGRSSHGGKLFLAAERSPTGLPSEPPIDPADEGDVRDALDELRAWVRSTVGVGRIGQGDAVSWDPERLEYGFEVTARNPVGGNLTFSVHPANDGRCEWHSFDVGGRSGPGEVGEGEIKRTSRSVIPANVSFRGMPNARWWAFETGTMNLAAVRPEKREVAKLIVLDFMLVHGNDWYVLPLRQPQGSLCRVDSLVVHDVFGGLTLIERADRGSAPGGPRWTLFSTTTVDDNGIADSFLAPPTPGAAAQSGEAIEEVRFVRDEMANLAWGIERVVQNGIGESWPAHERSLTATPTDRLQPTENEPRLRYRIQTSVPEHWIPFLPVAIDPDRREVVLERGVLLSSEGTVPPEPTGRILRPTRSLGSPYRLREEELPRVGLQVRRMVNRCRWVDGSTHVWLARRKLSGAREEGSGLLYDVATEPEPEG